MADLTRFLRAALSLHGVTAGALAQSLDPPVSESMIYSVAAGRKTSARVAAAIAECITSAGLTVPGAEPADDDDAADPVADVPDGAVVGPAETIESGGEAPPVGVSSTPAPAAVTGGYAHFRVVRFDRTSGRAVEVMGSGLTRHAARDLAAQHREADFEREHVVGYRIESADLKTQAALAGMDLEDKSEAHESADPVDQARRFVAGRLAA